MRNYKYNSIWDDPNWCFMRNRIVSPKEREIHTKIVEMMEAKTTDMQSDPWYGTRYGIPQDDIYDLAAAIIKELNLGK